MNNPFSRLKHYLPDKLDPQENHATECLAACLVLSNQVRIAFVQFLSNKIQINTSADIEVTTQLPITPGGFIDLLLEQPGKFKIAVEVKVKSPENCPHHREQLENYKKWLKNNSNGLLFTLVRDKDTTFSPEKFGADGRYTWRNLRDYFRDLGKTASDTDSNIIKNFCEYLESEGIVKNYEAKDLLNYAAGIKAREALDGIFNQVRSRLEVEKFATRVIDDGKTDCWPRMEVQHPDWETIFGKGDNWKIFLWYAIPGIWGRTSEEQHGFLPEIMLQRIDHQNDWEYIKSKLPEWEKNLKSKGFGWSVNHTWKQQSNTEAVKIQSQPKYIACSRESDGLNASAFSPTEDELVSQLVNRVKRHAEIINSLMQSP